MKYIAILFFTIVLTNFSNAKTMSMVDLLTDYPAYFNALIQGVSIRADDVFTNPNTAELIESYFKPYQVKSLLD
ncbi:MAG: hypothetical protein P8H57_13115 [Emcibacteraceae bacterium]|uniref:hypothetical protein n=1 Tax=Pseudemcibacter sp. TaxID=2943293 RepID=UPI003F69AE1D|nr:hypothetical protein [Emcibacteraceae bacterium]MDG1728080.1 hypothetical protein [Emcibacteraceae bacterium]